MQCLHIHTNTEGATNLTFEIEKSLLMQAFLNRSSMCLQDTQEVKWPAKPHIFLSYQM